MAVDRGEEDMKDYEFYDTDREEDSDRVNDDDYDDDDDHDDDDYDDNDDDDDDDDDQNDNDQDDNDDDDTVKTHEKKNLTGTSPSVCCKYQCVSMFDDEFKSRLKSDLSKLSTAERRIFLFAMISINEKKKKIPKNTKSSKFFEYTVREYGVLRTVCKTAFIFLHDTTQALVRTLCMKMAANCLIPTDKRGKHEQQPTISEQSKELIKTHFFSTLESPTIFKCSKKRSGTPNINQLWLDYKKKHGHLSRSTYTKYIRSFLTPDILSKFMCANEAQLLLIQVKKYRKH